MAVWTATVVVALAVLATIYNPARGASLDRGVPVRMTDDGRYLPIIKHHHHAHRHGRRYRVGADPRPRLWCGWWMRHHEHVQNILGNRALWWAHHWGYPGSKSNPEIGDVVVWNHGNGHGHVGVVVGGCNAGRCPIKSGNYNNAVRTVMMNVRNAYAVRRPASAVTAFGF